MTIRADYKLCSNERYWPAYEYLRLRVLHLNSAC